MTSECRFCGQALEEVPEPVGSWVNWWEITEKTIERWHTMYEEKRYDDLKQEMTLYDWPKFKEEHKESYDAWFKFIVDEIQDSDLSSELIKTVWEGEMYRKASFLKTYTHWDDKIPEE